MICTRRVNIHAFVFFLFFQIVNISRNKKMTTIVKSAIQSKKIVFHQDDLKKLSGKDGINTVNEKIGKSQHEIKGVYTIVRNGGTVLFQSKIDTKHTLLIHYPAETRSDYFYLLFYESSSCLNFRTNTEVSIDEKILNHQSKSGSIFWTSNVDVEVMIPTQTTVDFQLIVVHKSIFDDFIKAKIVLNKDKLSLMANSSEGIFHFSNCFYNTQKFIHGENNSIYQSDFAKESILEYLTLNIELSKYSFTLWSLFVVMFVEKKICDIPAIYKPNIEDLCQQFKYSESQLSKTFKQVFGIPVYKYHRHIHMEYARWLLETQQLNVGEVGEQLGYADRKAFSRTFKTHYMENPKFFKSRAL